MPFQTKALLIGIVVATNVGGYLLYSNGRPPDGDAVAEQADVPEVNEPVAAAPAPVERPASNGMAAAAETAREAGLRASAEGRHDEAIARFREAIELGSADESLVERLVAAQRARAASAAPQPARREALPPVTPRGTRDRSADRGRRPRTADVQPEPVVEAVEATPPPPPPPEPEPEPVVVPAAEVPGNEMERNPYLRGGG